MENQVEKQTVEIKMDRKSKALFVIIALLIAGSVAVTFWRYMVKKDYIIEAQADCDPETENCFIWKCNPNSMEEGEECTGVPDNDIWYYKIVRRNAKNIPLCDPNDENCEAFTCPEGEKDCEEVFCVAGNAKEGDECNDPEKYILENPPEENATCEEGDTECEAAAENEECAPDDQECLDGQSSEEECAPDDQKCLDSEQPAPTDDKNQKSGGSSLQNTVPEGVEPM
jgi:hypothetical protein